VGVLAELGTEGQAFFEALAGAIVKHPEATRRLLLEAARSVDRLEQLDSIITGKSDWIQLMHFRVQNGDKQEVSVTIDGVLAEARQQQANLANLLRVITPNLNADSGANKERDVLDEIAQRRSARGAVSSPSAVRPGGK
jgi:hypothetical protein